MRRTARRLLVASLFFGVATTGLRAQSTLFFIELQAVGAWSSASGKVELFSLTPDDAMQKPSLGFDLVRRFRGQTRDVGVLALQARLAFDQKGERKVEPQLYNASLRLKAGFADVWFGHDRPALGLSYALDSHALLLPAPPMLGFGFDRDWGIGLRRDFPWGDAALSVTAGSGMPLLLRGNVLAAARVSRGVRDRDNWSLGLSLAAGKVLETMGYALMSEDPVSWTAAGLDATYLWRSLETRAEVLLGRKAGGTVALFFWRAGLNLLSENRLKVEAQPVLLRVDGSWRTSFASGMTYQLSADLAGRIMILYDRGRRDARVVAQVYWYKGL